VQPLPMLTCLNAARPGLEGGLRPFKNIAGSRRLMTVLGKCNEKIAETVTTFAPEAASSPVRQSGVSNRR